VVVFLNADRTFGRCQVGFETNFFSTVLVSCTPLAGMFHRQMVLKPPPTPPLEGRKERTVINVFNSLIF